VDIAPSGFVWARTRSQPTGWGPDGTRYGEVTGSSSPVLARRVRAALAAVALARGAEVEVAQLFDSEVLL
jgi:hypothetical protein